MHEIRLATAQPFDAAGLFRYLEGHAIAGVESASEAHYARMVMIDPTTPATLTVSSDRADGVVMTTNVAMSNAQISALNTRVRQLANLDADSVAIDAHLTADPVMAERVRTHPGIRLPGSLDPEEQLFRTLIGQQISTVAARTVLGRLSQELCGNSGLFPTASQLVERGGEVLRGPAKRRETVLRVATALVNSELVLSPTLSVDELRKALTAFAGIGEWTAGYVAMRALSAQDVMLSTDLVLLKGAARLGLPSTPRGIAEYARRWAPYRSYAGLHLWRAAQEAR